MLHICNKCEVISVLSGNVAEWVRDLRRENNLSMEQLGKAVNVDKSTVSRIENGELFKCDIALSLAEYFGVSTDYLFGLTDDKSPVNYDLKKLGISSDIVNDKSERITADEAEKYITDSDYVAVYFELTKENNASTECEYFFIISEIYGESTRKIKIDFEQSKYDSYVENIYTDKLVSALFYIYENYGPLPNGLIIIPKTETE